MLLPVAQLVLITCLPLSTSPYELLWTNLAEPLRRRLTVDSETKRMIRDDSSSSSQSQNFHPIGVRKMSNDGGEMFFPEYWTFETNRPNDPQHPVVLDKRKPILRSLDLEIPSTLSQNATILPSLQAPFSLHSDQADTPLLRRLFPFQKRQFSCPADTNACTSINRPNSCCAIDEVCQQITDTGNGDVGCCSQGQTCSGQLVGCAAGYESCPGAQGGGCCVPGSSCMGVGCVINSTDTVTINPIATAGPNPPPPPPSSSSLEPITASTQTFTVGTTLLFTVTGTRPSSSSSSSPLHPSTSSHPSTSPPPSSPPPSSPTSTKTTPAALIPLRPTSGSPSTTRTTTAPTTATLIPSICPTGFYDCAAFHHPGCCRVGRDCAVSSCPLASTSTALVSDGVTVGVAAVSTAGLGGEGGCALGWFSCAGQTGGSGGGGSAGVSASGEQASGCCPSGYICGASCTASGVLVAGTGTVGVTGTVKVAKDNGASSGSWRKGVKNGSGWLYGWICAGWIALLVLFA